MGTYAHNLDLDDSDIESATWNPKDKSDLENVLDIIPEPESTPKPAKSTKYQLCIKLMDPAANLPTCATPRSARYDLYSCKITMIPPGTRKPVNTGISIAIPPRTYTRITSRFGLSVKGVNIGARVIGNDYHGLVKAVLINNSNTEF